MNFDQLHQLDAIATYGTISAAAEHLHISQPALSRSLARLEDELDTQLLDRNGRKISLNQAGTIALEYIRTILHEERLMKIALDDLSNKAGTLLVGTVAPAPLWRLTAQSIERFPDRLLTSRTMHQNDVEREIINRNIDLGITRKPLHYPAVHCCHLMDETLAITAPNTHPLARKSSLTFKDIDGEDFLLMGNIGFWHEMVASKMPHSSFLIQEDRMVFEQLAVTSPLLGFVTDAAYLSGEMPERVVIPLDEPEAHASFYLLANIDGSKQALELFNWVKENKKVQSEMR